MRSSSASRSPGGAPPRGVYSISSVPTSPRSDRASRLRVYLLSMGIRTACFVVAGVIAIVDGPLWAAWVCVVAAVVLPYPAVVLANNVDRRGETHGYEAPLPSALDAPGSDRDSAREALPHGPAADPPWRGGDIWRG